MTFFTLAILALTVAVSQLIYIAATACVGAVFGIKVTELKLGFGPYLGTPNIAGVPVEVCALPFSSTVMFHTRQAATADTLEGTYEDASPWQLALTALAGPVAQWLVAIALIGTTAFPAFLSGFVQFIRGIIHPIDVGQALAGQIITTVDSAPLPFVLGLALCKIAASTLYPIPGLSGGNALLALLIPTTPTGMIVQQHLARAGTLTWFGMLAVWAWVILTLQ